MSEQFLERNRNTIAALTLVGVLILLWCKYKEYKDKKDGMKSKDAGYWGVGSNLAHAGERSDGSATASFVTNSYRHENQEGIGSTSGNDRPMFWNQGDLGDSDLKAHYSKTLGQGSPATSGFRPKNASYVDGMSGSRFSDAALEQQLH